MCTFFYTAGILAPPQQLTIHLSNSTLTLSWIVPPSYEVSNPPTILYHTLVNNVTNVEVHVNTSTCMPSMLCNSSLDLSDLSLMIHNAYNGKIEFKFFAVNGAGKGNVTTYILNAIKRASG